MFKLIRKQIVDDACLELIYNGIFMHSHEINNPSSAGKIHAAFKVNFHLTRSRFICGWIISAAESSRCKIFVIFNNFYVIQFTCSSWSHIKH